MPDTVVYSVTLDRDQTILEKAITHSPGYSGDFVVVITIHHIGTNVNGSIFHLQS